MKISRAAPSTATTQPTMGPPVDSPSTPASQNPRLEPMMPTTMLAMAPICAFVFMRMLASQPTTAPTIKVTIQCMPLLLDHRAWTLGIARERRDSTLLTRGRGADDDDRYPRAGRAGSRLGVYRPRLAL